MFLFYSGKVIFCANCFSSTTHAKKRIFVMNRKERTREDFDLERTGSKHIIVTSIREEQQQAARATSAAAATTKSSSSIAISPILLAFKMEQYTAILADETKPSTLYFEWIFEHYVNRTVRSDPTVVLLLNEVKFNRDIPSFKSSMHWDGWDGSTTCESFSISLCAHSLSKLVVPLEEEDDDNDSLPGLISIPSDDASEPA